MSYQDTLSRIYGLGRFGIRPGLERIRTILKALSDPQDCLSVIHVAGTNGKGSTSAFLASVLDAAGYRVGLFTSPHLIAFPERIRLNGKEIAEEEVLRLADTVLPVAPDGSTFFEIVTAMAYLAFAEHGVGPAVMEVGMGGRFDATNAAKGILSIITPIALDHCQYLGDDIAAIALQKAGVIKQGSPVVSAPQLPEARSVVREQCANLGSPLYLHGLDFSADRKGSLIAYRGLEWELEGISPGIPGRCQSVNAAAALAAAELLGRDRFPMSRTAALRGIEEARWPGRMEMFPGTPRILLDGAHNPAGASALAESLQDIRRRNLTMLIGMASDKDADGMLERLLPLADRAVTVTPAIPRGLPSAILAEHCRQLGFEAEDAGSVTEGLDNAVAGAHADDLVVVCGSLFVVGEARARLTSRRFEPFRG
jgi:dihydrofolate synthase/folylpolyglutamate synthase